MRMTRWPALRIMPQEIEARSNAELRRIMLEALGFEKHLAARNARPAARLPAWDIL
jgi:hypothetical protein